MDGQPVWLATVSRRHYGSIVSTGFWSTLMFDKAEKFAHGVLRGIGRADRERAFRMKITFCIHRALSDIELENLPAYWSDALGGLAGGPVEVLWSRGIKHKPAAMPCRNPGQKIIDQNRPDLWVPIDCGRCEPCLARLMSYAYAHLDRTNAGSRRQVMKLIVCESIATVVLHLREDDGNRHYTGGLKCDQVFLCKPSGPLNGWDTKIGVPVSPKAARAIAQAPRFCSRCVNEWERRLNQEEYASE